MERGEAPAKPGRRSRQCSHGGLTALEQALLSERLKLMMADAGFQAARRMAMGRKLYVYDTLELKPGERRLYVVEGQPAPSLWKGATEVPVTRAQDKAYGQLLASGTIERLAARYDLSPSTVRNALFHRGPLPPYTLRPGQAVRGQLLPGVSRWPGEEAPSVEVGRAPLPGWSALGAALEREGLPEETVARITEAMEPWLTQDHLHLLGQGPLPSPQAGLPQIWVRLDIPPGVPAQEVSLAYRLWDAQRRQADGFLGRAGPQRRRASPLLEEAQDILLEPGPLGPRRLLEAIAQASADQEDLPSQEEDRRKAKLLAGRRHHLKKRRPPGPDLR